MQLTVSIPRVRVAVHPVNLPIKRCIVFTNSNAGTAGQRSLPYLDLVAPALFVDQHRHRIPVKRLHLKGIHMTNKTTLGPHHSPRFEKVGKNSFGVGLA